MDRIIAYTNRAPQNNLGGIAQVMSYALSEHDYWVGPGEAFPESGALAYAQKNGYEDKKLCDFNVRSFQYPESVRSGQYSLALEVLWPIMHHLSSEAQKSLYRLDPNKEKFIAYQNFIEIANECVNSLKPNRKDIILVHDFTSIGVHSQNTKKNVYTSHTPIPPAHKIETITVNGESIFSNQDFSDLVKRFSCYSLITAHRERDLTNLTTWFERVDPFFAKLSDNNYQFMGKELFLQRVFVGTSPSDNRNSAMQNFVSADLKEVLHRTHGKTVVLDAHRFDYTKGTKNLADAIDEYFSNYPENLDSVCFLAIVQPARHGMIGFEKYQEDVRKKFSYLHDKYGESVIFLNGMDHADLMALMAADHVKVILGLAETTDGHNLTLREFCDANEIGARKTMVVSEGVGAVELLQPSHTIPEGFSPQQLAVSIDQALSSLEHPNACTEFARMQNISRIYTSQTYVSTIKNLCESFR